MEIKIGITAHHNGRFGFKICRIEAPADGQTWVQAEKAQLTQECFNQVGGQGVWAQRGCAYPLLMPKLSFAAALHAVHCLHNECHAQQQA